MKKTTEIEVYILLVIMFCGGFLIVGLLDGFWDAIGTTLLIFSTNSRYRVETIKEKLKDYYDKKSDEQWKDYPEDHETRTGHGEL